jgi:hypothetical protein
VIAETYERDGVTVAIHHDEDGSSADPRDNDNLAHFYCWHPDYRLGDEQFTQRDHDSMTDVIEFLVTERKALVIVPLFLLDHSGISMSAGRALDLEAWSAADIESRGRFVGDEAGWDTTHVGFAYVTQERVDLLGVPDGVEEYERQLRGEVEEYDLFLRGEVYFYVVGPEPFREVVGGFIGYEQVEEAANEAASGVRYVLDREAKEAAYWAACDVVTVAA